MPHPTISVVIASRSRHDHLRLTLQELLKQEYPGEIEMIVLDDASPESLKPVLDEVWPTATFIRKEQNVGQCACRTEGFRVATGRYIFQLDDDAHPVNRDCISRAVALLEERPEIGILNCYSFNGPVFPPGGLPPIEPRYCISFHGCAVFFRSEALLKVDGYLTFLERQWEEEDISIRIMKAGWAVYFGSTLQVHHRLSGINRNAAWTWKHGVRNKLWGLLMYWPLHRLPVDMSWTFALAFWDAARLRRFGALAEAIVLFAKGATHVLTLRSPMDPTMMRRYDALRFGTNLRTVEQFYHPPATGVSGILRWFTGTWWNRPRERNFWDRRAGDIGSTETVKFAHEYQTRDTASKQ